MNEQPSSLFLEKIAKKLLDKFMSKEPRGVGLFIEHSDMLHSR